MLQVTIAIEGPDENNLAWVTVDYLDAITGRFTLDYDELAAARAKGIDSVVELLCEHCDPDSFDNLQCGVLDKHPVVFEGEVIREETLRDFFRFPDSRG